MTKVDSSLVQYFEMFRAKKEALSSLEGSLLIFLPNTEPVYTINLFIDQTE